MLTAWTARDFYRIALSDDAHCRARAESAARLAADQHAGRSQRGDLDAGFAGRESADRDHCLHRRQPDTIHVPDLRQRQRYRVEWLLQP